MMNQAVNIGIAKDGISYSQSLSTNITSGTGFQDQNLTYNAIYNGQTVKVNYTLKYIQPATTDDNTSKGGGNNKN